MMTRTELYAPASATAIAAALALSSTPALSQQAQPADPAPAPVEDTTPAPTLETAPITTDTSVTTPAATGTQTTKTARRATHLAAKARPAPAPVHVATRTVATHPVASKPVQAAVPAAATPPPAAVPSARPAPVVDLAAKPAAPAQTNSVSPPTQLNRTELMFGAGALALIALAAAAIAMRRRRRAREEWIEQEQMEAEPGEPEAMGASDPIFADQPAVVAPAASAFAWDNAPRADQHAVAEADDSDRLPGETWVERAYRGPSPNNPSESLKTRLGRAAFFDKREREVAAGIAEPVDADEGLPEAMVDQQERESA